MTLENTKDTKLDIEGYESITESNPRMLEGIYKDFSRAVGAPAQKIQGCLMEIGTGSGLLTEAMALHSNLDIIATDVSLGFIRRTKARLDKVAPNISYVLCDGNKMPFRRESFDFVFGRSVLHHLLHYKEALAQVRDLLRPGGKAVFFEPVQSGKAMIAFMYRIILGIEASTGTLGLTEREKNKLQVGAKGMTRSASVSQDEAVLASMEDKYIFDIDDLRDVGLSLGFARTNYVNMRDINPTYFPYLNLSLKSIGIRREVIDKLIWLRSAFGDTIGAVAGDKLTGPMGYFVFEKDMRSDTQVSTLPKRSKRVFF